MQVISRVRTDTGILVHAERGEVREDTLARVAATPTLIKLVFTVKEFRRTRRGRILVREGIRAVMLTKVNETWSTLTDTSAMTDTDAPVEEIYRGRVESPDEALERIAHEEMCHRPGSSRHPMMNAARKEQFKRGGL
jgi:hypothetical protein